MFIFYQIFLDHVVWVMVQILYDPLIDVVVAANLFVLEEWW